ncbi:MAG: precorrin-6y C5,15-methyltransferase (decarboxylating) subunit CbiE [Ruminococcus sp.]|nr:precorrin-6y C5,15-methyltransferase (decarboxylating) subunit CbiE [Ruminococcus sp.]
MKVCIVGTGMDGRDTLTKEAENAVISADILIGAERMLEPFMQSGKELFISYKPAEIAGKIRECGCGTAAVLMSGDCGFFSGAKKLLPLLKEHDISVFPGISSAVYFCGRLGISYENMKFVSLHGRAANIAVNVRMNERCFFLLGGGTSASAVCERLCSFGLPDVTVHIGADLGSENERILSGTASGLAWTDIAGLAVMIVENRAYLRHIPSAIGDDEFTRGEIPMTKSEVRCIAVSKLNICADSVVWDIGCGTGSVSVEAAFRCPDGQVLAFDKKPEAAALTDKNAHIFGCDNITAAEGECPGILAGAPAPDKVFIGGTSGNMEAVFDCVRAKSPAADIVVTAVSLETLHEVVSCFERYGSAPEVVQAAVTRTKKVGNHTMLQAQNPVFIISGRLK